MAASSLTLIIVHGIPECHMFRAIGFIWEIPDIMTPVPRKSSVLSE